MAFKYPGGLITKNPVTPSGPYQTGSASGIWKLSEEAYWKQQGLWPIAGNVVPTFDYLVVAGGGGGSYQTGAGGGAAASGGAQAIGYAGTQGLIVIAYYVSTARAFSYGYIIG